tara:strand:- start:28 stop:1287 length:1260 start_codon:yes stop_codon:yes gene_type:complete
MADRAGLPYCTPWKNKMLPALKLSHTFFIQVLTSTGKFQNTSGLVDVWAVDDCLWNDWPGWDITNTGSNATTNSNNFSIHMKLYEAIFGDDTSYVETFRQPDAFIDGTVGLTTHNSTNIDTGLEAPDFSPICGFTVRFDRGGGPPNGVHRGYNASNMMTSRLPSGVDSDTLSGWRGSNGNLQVPRVIAPGLMINFNVDNDTDFFDSDGTFEFEVNSPAQVSYLSKQAFSTPWEAAKGPHMIKSGEAPGLSINPFYLGGNRLFNGADGSLRPINYGMPMGSETKINGVWTVWWQHPYVGGDTVVTEILPKEAFNGFTFIMDRFHSSVRKKGDGNIGISVFLEGSTDKENWFEVQKFVDDVMWNYAIEGATYLIPPVVWSGTDSASVRAEFLRIKFEFETGGSSTDTYHSGQWVQSAIVPL